MMEADPIQMKALASLERLRHDLMEHDPPTTTTTDANCISSSNSEHNSRLLLTGLMGKPSWMMPTTAAAAAAAADTRIRNEQHSNTNQIRGVYLHGEVWAVWQDVSHE